MKIAVLYCGSSHTGSLLNFLINFAQVEPILVSPGTSYETLLGFGNLGGIIITGSPLSVLNPDSPKISMSIYEQEQTPVLGLCYGLQRMTMDLGGDVVRFPAAEKGLVRLKITPENDEDFFPLYRGFTEEGIDVFMSHSCQVRQMPEGFRRTGKTKATVIASMERNNLIGIQFHPEKQGHGSGKQIMYNFLRICGVEA